ncbi:ABC transporter ATP-binding protein [Bacteroides ovatus]|mgnify:FL=1|jgi:ATP-binding cassette, subfamily B, bacterial|uniref:ABC transporter ATP-binding protein n=3 Tax=Bacteroides TaxID=816 RepID=UPI002FEE522E
MKRRMMRQLLWIFALTRGYRWKMVGYISLDILTLLLGLAFVYESKHAVDIVTGSAAGSLRLIILLIVSSVALGILTGQWSAWISERMKVRMTVALQDTLVDSQMRAVWESTKRWHTGDLLFRLNTDVAEVVQMIVITFPSLFVTGIRMTASWLLLWMMDSVLAWMILAISPLFLFSKIYYRRMRKLSRETKEMESNLGIVLQENLRQRLLIRALGMDEARQEKYREVQEAIKLRKYNLLQFDFFARMLLKYAFNGGYLLAFVWGIYRLHTGLVTFGTLTAFLQLVSRIQGPVLTAIAFVPAAIRCRTAVERLITMNEEECEVREPAVSVGSLQAVELRDVTFGYEDRKVIERLSATLRPGFPTAIVGTTGKGKTTLIRLMLALVRPEKGRLFLQTDTAEIPVTVGTRGYFSYVPQGNTLFSGTIRENLLLVAPRASEEEMADALALACAGFVDSLPEGMDTVIGESGYGLSEGQAQRIAIARALLHQGKIWLFDEATSALDRNTSERLVRNLLRIGQDKILIFVTHDSRLTDACSQVVRLDE